MISLLIAAVIAAAIPLQAGPLLRDGVRDRLDRVVRTAGDRWTLQRAVRFTAVPGLRNETEIYEWRDTNGQERIQISIYHYGDAAEAREHIDHLILAIATRPLNGIGDAAKVASMGESGPSTVHFSVDWMYAQVSAPTAELAIRLAGEMAKELRR